MDGKTFSEECVNIFRDFNIDVSVARFHNVMVQMDNGLGEEKKHQALLENLLRQK